KNFPVLDIPVTTPTQTTLTGTLDSTVGGTFRLEFFANTLADPSAFGEGQTFLGALTITDGGAGDTNAAPGLIGFSFTATGNFQGKVFTSTAMNTATNDTSEFSAATPVPVFWDGGGTTSNWTDRFNWVGDAVPGTADTAVIDQAGTFTVTLDANVSVAGLQLGGTSGTQTLDAGTRTLTVSGGAQVLSHGAI